MAQLPPQWWQLYLERFLVVRSYFLRELPREDEDDFDFELLEERDFDEDVERDFEELDRAGVDLRVLEDDERVVLEERDFDGVIVRLGV